MAESVLILPDSHYPDTDMRVYNAVLGAIKEVKPDRIIHIGDVMDYPQPSRWTKGTRYEFEGSVFEDSEKAIKNFIEPLRKVFDGPIGFHEGNHDLRPRVYLEKYAPALAETEKFNFENLLRFDEFGIERLPDFNKVAPGWITTHGHLGGIRLSQIAGNTPLNAAKKMGVSVVMGHSHRAGIGHYTVGFDGSGSTLTGMEVGHIMNPKKATYLQGATGNWQQALGWLTIDGQHVTPTLIPVSKGKFSIEGRVFKI